jgi:cytochrome c-type biogenesis protein CcmH/NrfF
VCSTCTGHSGVQSRATVALVWRWLLAGSILLGVVLWPERSEAQRHQDRPNAEQAEEAIGQLRSPYCPGLMLEVCPSPSAAMLRDSIYNLAAEGMTTDQLVEWMLTRHGEEWRGVPQRSGLGLLAWVMPPLALLIGVGVLVGWMRASRAQAEEAVAATPPSESISDTDRDKLTAALREWEESGGEEV